MIYHITPRETWQSTLIEGIYQADSLKSEGFIHASNRSQIISTANRYYCNQNGLVLLMIDDQQVKAEIRYENLEGGSEKFPHIYGPLNMDAVVKVFSLTPQVNGTFIFPENEES